MAILFMITNKWHGMWSNNEVSEYVIASLTCLIIVVSLLGNLMVIVAVAKTKTLQRMSTAWILSLAAADLGKAAICMPIFVVLLLSSDWSLSKDMCPVYHCFQMSLEVVSIFNLTAISIDRVFMITRPLTYQRTMNLTKIMVCICAVWTLGFLFGFLQLLWWENGGLEGSQWKDFILELLGKYKLDCQYHPPPAMAIVELLYCVCCTYDYNVGGLHKNLYGCTLSNAQNEA